MTSTDHLTSASQPARRAGPAPAADGPVVSVVVVSYNTREWLERCLASLPAASQHELDVIVVDNASSDGSADTVAGGFPTVRLVRNEENLGFARAVNLGAALARGDYLLLLNPDGTLRPGAIDALVDFARAHPEYAICGGRTVSPAGDLDPRSCWAAPTLWSLFCSATMLSTLRPRSRWFDPEAMGAFRRDRARPVDIVTGCLLLVALDDWRSLGGFDERFFVYGEDADLCLRAAASGRRCAITPDAVMVHAVGASSATRPDKHELLLQGRITLVRTHWSGWRAAAGVALIVGGVGTRAALARAGVGRGTGWDEVWRRRRRWWRGYPPVAEAGSHTGTATVTGRSSLRTGWARRARFARSVLDPRSLVHAVRLVHYFNYSHVAEVGKVSTGEDVRLAPNVSFTNGERISIGARSRVGARCHLWAGDHDGAIRIGSDCNFGPNCFVTASNYGIEAGTPFLDQGKQDADIAIGDDVWLGTSVTVLAGVTIGSGTVVAAGSVVTRDLPGNVVAGGVPARVLRER